MAQGLFHAKGYDRVSLAELTDALQIKPPSFYAAFGNKNGLYTRVLDRYAETGAIPFSEILHDNQPVAEGLKALLEEAARRYGADPEAPGCLVLEGTRCHDAQARAAAGVFHRAALDQIHAYVAARAPEEADRVTDFVGTLMAGLSAMAREGHDADRLLATARLAGQALTTE
jgi:TetR/AcrR family transcriptional repressor for divergent bdcA